MPIEDAAGSLLHRLVIRITDGGAILVLAQKRSHLLALLGVQGFDFVDDLSCSHGFTLFEYPLKDKPPPRHSRREILSP